MRWSGVQWSEEERGTVRCAGGPTGQWRPGERGAAGEEQRITSTVAVSPACGQEGTVGELQP